MGGTSARIVRKPRAKADAIDIATYIADDSEDAAFRFLDAVEESYELLAENPNIGRGRTFSSPELAGVSSWPVKGFANYLIFFRTMDLRTTDNACIEIVRVVDGRRDLPELFG